MTHESKAEPASATCAAFSRTDALLHRPGTLFYRTAATSFKGAAFQTAASFRKRSSGVAGALAGTASPSTTPTLRSLTPSLSTSVSPQHQRQTVCALCTPSAARESTLPRQQRLRRTAPAAQSLPAPAASTRFGRQQPPQIGPAARTPSARTAWNLRHWRRQQPRTASARHATHAPRVAWKRCRVLQPPTDNATPAARAPAASLRRSPAPQSRTPCVSPAQPAGLGST